MWEAEYWVWEAEWVRAVAATAVVMAEAEDEEDWVASLFLADIRSTRAIR